MRDNRTALGCHGQFQDEFIGRIPKNRAPKEMNVLPMTDAAQVIHESDDLAPAEAEFVRSRRRTASYSKTRGTETAISNVPALSKLNT